MARDQGYWVRLGLDSSGFKTGMDQARGSTLEFYRDVSVSLNMTMMIFDKVMEYGQKFLRLADEASEFVSAIDKLSTTTGMSTDELQRWSNVARYADGDIGSLAQMVNKLQINLNDQGETGEKARKIMDAMHISYRNADGSLKSTNALFPATIEGLKGLGSSADRVTAANALFGKSYQELGGYLNMTQGEMQSYYDKASILTDVQQQKLRIYEDAVKDLGGTYQNLSHIIGSDLANSFTLASWALDKSLKDNKTNIDALFTYIDQFIGYEYFAGQYIAHLFTDPISIEGEKKWIENWKKDYRDMMAELYDQPFDAYADAKKRFGIGNSTPPDLSSDKSRSSELSAFQIKDLQLQYQKMSTITLPEQRKELVTLNKEYSAVGDRGSDAAKKIKLKIDELTISIAQNENQIAEWAEKLKTTGAGVSAAIGGSTYNEMFASALNVSSAKTDWAGFSDLANMTEAELQENAKGGLGKSKSLAERAQQYLSLMKSSPAGTGTASSKISGADSELSKLQNQYSSIETAFSKHLDQMGAHYVRSEQNALTHWTAETELMRISEENMSEGWRKYVDFAAAYPTIHNIGIVTWTKKGPDWTPESNPVFMQTARRASLASQDLTYKTADFSGVKMSGGGNQKQTTEVKIVVEDKTSGGIKANVTAVKNDPAGVYGVGGR